MYAVIAVASGSIETPRHTSYSRGLNDGIQFRQHDVVSEIRESRESRLATDHAGGGESLVRISHCTPDTHEPLAELLVARLLLLLLSSHLPDPVIDLLPDMVAAPSDWATSWHLNYFVRGRGGLCGGLNRLSHPSDFPGGWRPSNIGNAPVPGTRSRDCFLLVSCETPELALRCHHRNGDGAHQSADRYTPVGPLLTATFLFARGVPRNARSQCHQ